MSKIKYFIASVKAVVGPTRKREYENILEDNPSHNYQRDLGSEEPIKKLYNQYLMM